MRQMLRQATIPVFRLAEASGSSRLLGSSAWRRRRLLVLCYHGVARYDEHEWESWYITAELLRRRLQLLVEERCTVLPLADAVNGLHSGTLPDRSVVITFDDGMHDFFSVAFPIVESFGFPVTLYLTTYYVEFNRPVFDPMCSYLLWKGQRAGRPALEWPEVLSSSVTLDDAGRAHANTLIRQFARQRRLSGRDKDDLLAELATRLELDYRDLCRKRVMHLVAPEEAAQLAARGVDIEYHTHRHREYRNREHMLAELEDNRRCIMRYTPKEPRHFCYTGGFVLPEHLGYLREYGIVSATTCYRGLCTPRTDPLLLPRFGDHMTASEVEFKAWLHGTAALLPRKHRLVGADQLFEEDELVTT
jgi:peptidoglycan/xylan/chitin deacetylase (PgdA/CDA1 family)